MSNLPPLGDVICAIVRHHGPSVTLCDLDVLFAASDLSPSPATVREHVVALLESGSLRLIAPDPEFDSSVPPAVTAFAN